MIDPLSEKVYSVNPYAYVDNNPTNNIDPNGMETYYGNEAQALFTQIQRQIKNQHTNEQDDPPKKSERPGYFRAFYNKKVDAQAISNLIEGGVTYAPLGEAASATGKFLSFNANAGYGIEIGNLSLMYRNPSVGGGTIAAYNSSKIRLRLDYHRIPNVDGMSLHYHTNFGGRSLKAHRSLNPFTFGQPIKQKKNINTHT